MKFALILLLALPAAGQCDLTLKQSPTVHGMKLGTRGKELKAATVNLIGDLEGVPGYEGVHSLYIDTHNDLISKITVQYDPRVVSSWRNPNEYARVVSDTYKLPLNAWKYPDKNTATMQCKGFSVTADAYVINRLILTTDRN